MSKDTFNNSAENNQDKKSFEQRFEAFKNERFEALKKIFTLSEELGVNVVEIKKRDATAQESADKNKLIQNVENKAHTHESLNTLANETTKKIEETNNIDLEVLRIPNNQNALEFAENLLEKTGLSSVLDQVQKQTEARLGHSCIYSFDGMQDFA